MDNENTNTNTNQQSTQTPAVGGKREPSFAEAIFGVAAAPEENEGEQSTEERTGTPPEDTASLLLGESDNSTELESGTGAGEGAEVEEFYEFGDKKYTPAELEAVLSDHDTYQRYNQSVKPRVESVADYGNQFERLKTLAMTECEKTITELKRLLTSNQLDSRQYQQAHQQLTNTESRMMQLERAAEDEAKLRTNALNQARQQNARQAVATLTKQGWGRDDILSVGSIAQQVIGDKLADVMSPALMQVFRDAAELRQAKEGAAKRLRAKANTTLKTTKQAPQKQSPQQTTGEKSWGEMVFGDNK